MATIRKNELEGLNEGYTELVVKILKLGCQTKRPKDIGLAYLDTDGGKFWMYALGVSPESMKRNVELHPEWLVMDDEEA